MSTLATRRLPRPLVLAVGLATVLMAAVPAAAHADDPPEPGSQGEAVSQETLRFGVKGGISYADGRGSIESSGADIVGARSGFSVGVVAVYPWRDRLDVQGELLFVRRVTGATTAGAGFGGEADYEITGSFVQLPLLLRYRPEVSLGPLAPSLLLGPALSFPTSLTRELVVGGTTQALEFEPGGVDVGLLAGATFEVPLGGRTITLDARYTLGLRDVDAGAIPGGELKFGSFSAMAGVMF